MLLTPGLFSMRYAKYGRDYSFMHSRKYPAAAVCVLLQGLMEYLIHYILHVMNTV